MVCVPLFGQNPYPLIPIDTIQFVKYTKLTGNYPNDSSDYVNPAFKDLNYKDTVKFEGYVLFDPRLYGLSLSRKSTILLSASNGRAWGGVEVMCEPAGTGKNLTQLLNETKFYNNLKVGTKVRVTGVMRTFRGTAPAGTRQGNSQINVIANNYWDNSIQIINPNPIQLKPTKIRLDSLMMGNDSIGRVQNKISGEKWEGIYVELNNLKVRNRTQSGSRWLWSVEDNNGNSIDVSDFSGWFRNDNNSDSLLPISRFTPPQIGTQIKSFKGVIVESSIAGQYRYTIAPLQPSDIDTSIQFSISYNLPYDTLNLLNKDTITLTAPFGFKNYLWSNGDTSQSTTITNNGIYICVVTDSTGNKGIDSVIVYNLRYKPIDNLISCVKLNSLVLSSEKPVLIKSYLESPSSLYFELESFNGKRYFLSNYYTTFKNARDTAIKYSANLLNLESQSEFNHLESQIKNREGWNGYSSKSLSYWTGLTQMNDYFFIWSNGSKFQNFNWDINQPNGGNQIVVKLATKNSTLVFVDTTKLDSCRIILEIPNGNKYLWFSGDTISYKYFSRPIKNGVSWVKISNKIREIIDTFSLDLNYKGYPLRDEIINVCSNDSFIHLIVDSTFKYYKYDINTALKPISDTIIRTYYNTGYQGFVIVDSNDCICIDSVYVNFLKFNLNQNKNNLCKNDTMKALITIPSMFKLLGTFQGSDYYYYEEPTNWKKASFIANNVGGKLCVINSKSENDYILSKLPKKYGYESFWIGYYQDINTPFYNEPNGGWKWVDNSIDTFKNWTQGYPNNINNAMYASIGTYNFSNNKWIDLPDTGATIFNKTFPLIEVPVGVNINDQLNLKFKWNNFDSTSKSISRTIVNDTIYFLKVYNDNGECFDTAKYSVVKNEPKIGINNRIQCFNNQNFEFSNLNILDTGLIKFLWTFGDGSIDSTNNPIKTYIKDSTYIVTLETTNITFGCIDLDSVVVNCNPNPNVNYDIDDSIQCQVGNKFMFTNQSKIHLNDSLSFKWILENEVFNATDLTKSFEKFGIIKVKLLAKSTRGCTDSIEKSILIYQNPLISSIIGKVAVKPLSIEPYSVSLTDSTIFRWNVIGGNVISGQNNNLVSVQWGNSANGYIGVIANDKNGCLSDSANLNISITTVGLENLDLASKFNVYPNPTSSLINIVYDQSTLLDYRVVFMDVNGKIIIGNKNLKTIDITNYSEGIYYLEIESEGRKFTKKIVKVN